MSFAGNAYAVPGFSKAFLPATIGPGSVSTLRFDITDQDGIAVDDITFTDDLPAGLSIATPGSASTDCGPSAILSAPDGGTSISLTDGQLGPDASCSVSVSARRSASMPSTGSLPVKPLLGPPVMG